LSLRQWPISFTDSSATDGTHSLVKWIWNYGDGTTDSTTRPLYTHQYTAAGSYDVSLTVADNFAAGILLTNMHL
jgi:PKD repeat protein